MSILQVRTLPRSLFCSVLTPPDRLYLASYTSPPTSSTPFPPSAIPDPHKTTSQHVPPHVSRSPHKRNKSTIVNSSGLKPVYFTVDDALLYNAFHHDFGPLHIGHLYRFAVTLHDILGDPKNEGRVVVFWSRPDGRARGNAGCLLACYMVRSLPRILPCPAEADYCE